MKCFKCGYENQSGTRTCGRCSTKLPQFMKGAEARPPTAILTSLRKLKDEVLRQRITREALAQTLEQMLLHMEATKEKFKETSRKITDEHLAAQHIKTITAMDMLIGATEEVAQYVEDGDIRHVLKGLEQAEIADVDFQDALRMEHKNALTFKRTTIVLPPKPPKD
ncbi:MAG: zinc ribbon domain-containing protein [Candidatus Eremiobacteraeota bacterium]|nr:zinc ribbon domain-containing protein [Candidatus Eremiobacteraeota bacterium]